MAFKRSFRVHWVDTDTAGVMHFSNFFRYFEACEEEFYRSLSLPLTEIRDRLGVLLPRVEVHCQYKAACRLDELIDITLKVREVQEKTIIYDFQIIRQSDGKLAAEGFVKCIAVNSEWKAVPLPAEVARTVRNSIV
ncbi:MAG: thioesterase family protein [Candidatus Bathyarchaeia archaeon]|jgi:YbgC/YbaW family acyl-CoA thioester hydrolase